MLTPEQLEARKTGLGGSDIAVVLGISPYKTPVELYYEKIGELEPEDLSDNERVHFGNRLEEVVADEYAERRGVKVRRVNKTYRHKTLPFLLANIDRDVLNEDRVLECKTADRFTMRAELWGEPGTDEVPETYLMQCHHYLLVLGRAVCDLAVLVGGNEFRSYTIKRDAGMDDLIVRYGSAFWNGNVIARVPPPFDATNPRALDVVRRLYPGTSGEVIQADDECEVWRGAFKLAYDRASDLEKSANAMKAELLFRMGDAAVLEFADGTLFTRKVVQRKGYTVVVEPKSIIDCRWKKAKEE